jgi:Arylsulfotransferase (ASST)
LRWPSRWQHDPEAIGHDEYTFFDNESAGTPEFSVSRAVTLKLDTHNRVATLIASDDQPEGLVAASQGNAQTTPDGGLFVAWGALPYFSEFDQSGRLTFNAVLDWSQHLPRLRPPVRAGSRG